MSAARLTTPKPTTARHGDQPPEGTVPAVRVAAESGRSDLGSVPPGCSLTPFPSSDVPRPLLLSNVVSTTSVRSIRCTGSATVTPLHRLDDRLLVDVNEVARHTGGLHGLVLGYATYGVAL